MLKNVLFTTHAPPDYMPPLALSANQVVAGPNYPTVRDSDGGLVSLKLPSGRFDLADVLAAEGLADWPDLIAVLVDSFATCQPENLAALKARRLLLAADTHHGRKPLRKVVAYAKSEAFDAVAVIHDPHHAHWYVEAKVGPVGVVLNPSVRPYPQSREEIARRIVFVGRTSENHPRRGHLLNVLKAAGLPIEQRAVPAEGAAAEYGAAQISFNCSLNGDLNMRVLEVLAAGGFLVTDRLSPQTGLDTIFRPGEDFVTYGDEAELVRVMQRYLADPEACRRIAAHGQQTYLAAHTPEHRRKALQDFAESGVAPNYPADLRTTSTLDAGTNLDERMRIYEILQEIARQSPKLLVVADSAIGARTISDWVDLPGLSVDVVGRIARGEAFAAQLEQLGVSGQVHTNRDTTRGEILVLPPNADPLPYLASMRRLQLVILVCGAGGSIKSTSRLLTSNGFELASTSTAIFKRRNSPLRFD